jgi:hypothetical protein
VEKLKCGKMETHVVLRGRDGKVERLKDGKVERWKS